MMLRGGGHNVSIVSARDTSLRRVEPVLGRIVLLERGRHALARLGRRPGLGVEAVDGRDGPGGALGGGGEVEPGDVAVGGGGRGGAGILLERGGAQRAALRHGEHGRRIIRKEVVAGDAEVGRHVGDAHAGRRGRQLGQHARAAARDARAVVQHGERADGLRGRRGRGVGARVVLRAPPHGDHGQALVGARRRQRRRRGGLLHVGDVADARGRGRARGHHVLELEGRVGGEDGRGGEGEEGEEGEDRVHDGGWEVMAEDEVEMRRKRGGGGEDRGGSGGACKVAR